MLKLKPIQWDNESEYPHYPYCRKGTAGNPDSIELTFFLDSRNGIKYTAGVRTNIDVTMESSNDSIGGIYTSLEQAKQACQEWYEKAIQAFIS